MREAEIQPEKRNEKVGGINLRKAKMRIRNCEGTNKKRCWISIQQRFRLGHFVPHVSSFSTCKFRVAGASELRED
jgi:hypothetical protein